jgi:site-specific DNA-methyltransferase (adenine-specific)
LHSLLFQDALEGIQSLEENSIDLVILDPPYNVNAAKWDNIPNYFDWMCDILSESIRVLKKNGSLYLWGMSKNNDFLRLKLWLDEQSKIEFKNWIVWVHECKIHKKLKDRFLTKHEDLLFYGGENNTFNQHRDTPSPFQLQIFKDKYDENFFVSRDKLPPSQQKIFKNGLQLGSPVKSWWKGDSNVSNKKEKSLKKFAGYKSEWVCKRMIEVSSNPNDVILIPFAGTGTECKVAQLLNRDFIAFENNEDHYNIARERLLVG